MDDLERLRKQARDSKRREDAQKEAYRAHGRSYARGDLHIWKRAIRLALARNERIVSIGGDDLARDELRVPGFDHSQYRRWPVWTFYVSYKTELECLLGSQFKVDRGGYSALTISW